MRLFLLSFLLAPFMGAQSINPNQVRGTAGVLTPPGNQTIMQPQVSGSQTTLSINSLNNVLNAALFNGSDIGAKINAAVASLPSGCGKVFVPGAATPYSFATTIHLHRCTALIGSSGLSTVLQWTSLSGTAVIVSDSDGSSIYPGGYISDIYLSGPSQSSGTSVGLYFGGDPTCTGGCTSNPSTNYGDNFSVYNSKISFFQTGVQWGNHAFLEDFYSDQIANNGTGIKYPGDISDSGEAISFFGTKFNNSTSQGINLSGLGDFFFYGSACDYNLGGCLLLGGSSQAHFHGMHFEQGNGAFIQVSSSADPRLLLDIEGGTFSSTITTGGPDTAFIVVTDPAALSLTMHGTLVLAAHSYTNFLNWNPSTYQSKFSNTLDLTGNTGLFGNSNVLNVASTSCNDGTSYFQTCVIRRAIFSARASLASVAANTCSSQDIAMPGYVTDDIPVSLTKATSQAGLIISGVQTTPSSDHPGVTICNITALAILPTSNDLYTLTVQR